MNFDWQRIFKNHNSGVGGTSTARAKVPGGWLINNVTYTEVICNGNERNISESMCFVPDPNHEWEVDEV
jgi:hypothetical protein